HARISHGNEAYWVENVSAAGPILHNGRPLSSGMRVSLKDGDELRIGGYRLSVAFESDETSATILRGRTAAQAPARAAPAAVPRSNVAPPRTPEPARPPASPAGSPPASPSAERAVAAVAVAAAVAAAGSPPAGPSAERAVAAVPAAAAVAARQAGIAARGTRVARVRPMPEAGLDGEA